MISKYLALFLITFSIVLTNSASSQILSDSLNNSTVGTIIGGEFLPSGGWKSDRWDNIIMYDLNKYILKGRLEIDISNFDPLNQNSMRRHHILAMYSDSRGDHNHSSLNGPGLSEGSVWNLHTGSNYEGGGMKLLSIDGDKIETRVTNLNWNPDSTYHFVISWDESQVELSVDSVFIMSNENTRNFALRYLFVAREFTRSLDLVTGFPNNEYSAQIGPTYSNVFVYADSLVPELLDSDQVEFTVDLPEQNDILSFDMTFTYDPELLDFQSLETDSSGVPLNILFNSNPGQLVLGTFSPSPITQFENVVTAKFLTKFDTSNVRIVHLDLSRFLVNADEQPTQTKNYIFRPENIRTPVELSYFEAKVIYENSVELYWETASEANNLGFDIHRSKANETFSEIGFVKGSGTSSIYNSYQFTDSHLEPGKYIYRLKQINFDGTYTYSNERDVFINSPIDFILYENYPNPFYAKTKISFSIPSHLNFENMQIKIYDVRGRIVKNIKTGKSSGNYYEMFWEGKDNSGRRLASGVYFVSIETETVRTTRKILMLR